MDLEEGVRVTEKVAGPEEMGEGPVGVISWEWWNGPDRANLVFYTTTIWAC